MEIWENNLDLPSANNLTLVSGNNLVIGWEPIPPAYLQRRYPQAHFPIELVNGSIGRRERQIPHIARQTTIRHRYAPQEAFPPSLLHGRAMRRGKNRLVVWAKVYRQNYRVAEDALERWELYLEEDELPDFDGVGQPVETSTTLPLTHSPALPGGGATKEYWAVVRKRNKYDILSLNLHPTIITIDDAGAEEMGPLTAPEILRVLDGEDGEIIVFGRYPYGVDRNEADTWEVYAEDGVDPDPDLDTPVATGTFGAPGADYHLRTTADGLTPGSTYHVLLVVSRASESGAGEVGESVVVEFTLAETHDLEENTTWLFGGQENEIGS